MKYTYKYATVLRVQHADFTVNQTEIFGMNKKRKQLIEKLLEKIQSGEIVTGDKLMPERKLAEILGETRPVLREGLIALEAMGVLDIRDRQGFFLSSAEESDAQKMLQAVRSWPADTLSRAMEVRQIIEPPAAGIAAARRSEKALTKMRECLEKMKELSSEESETANREGAYWNTAFHIIIVEATKNAYMSRIYESVCAVMEQGVSVMRINTDPKDAGGRSISYREHAELYRLIEARDVRGAELAAEAHLKNTIAAFVKLGQIAPAADLFSQGFIGLFRRDGVKETESE